MQAIVTSETGLIFLLDIEKGIVVEKIGKQSFGNKILSCCWTDESREQFFYLTKSGSIFRVTRDLQSIQEICKNLFGCSSICSTTSNLVAFVGGDIKVFNFDGCEISTVEVKGEIQCLDCFEKSTLVVVAGKKRVPEVWDWKEKKLIWQADMPPPDFLGLPKRVYIKSCKFLSGTEICCVSAYGEFFLYNIEKSTKPIVEKITVADTCLQHMILDTKFKRNVLVGSTTGPVFRISVKDGKHRKCFKGQMGSVRGMSSVEGEDAFVVAGADKYLRVQDPEMSAKTCVKEIYLKQRLSGVLLFKVENENEDSEDELWNDLEKRTGEKRKREDDETLSKKPKLTEEENFLDSD